MIELIPLTLRIYEEFVSRRMAEPVEWKTIPAPQPGDPWTYGQALVHCARLWPDRHVVLRGGPARHEVGVVIQPGSRLLIIGRDTWGWEAAVKNAERTMRPPPAAKALTAEELEKRWQESVAATRARLKRKGNPQEAFGPKEKP